MVVRTNMTAMNLCRNWQGHQNKITSAVERLSSGYRINRAADDPSGLGISQRMKMQLSALKEQQNNSLDQLSVSKIQDSNLESIQTALQRMNELATKAMNGLYSEQDRKEIDAEYQQLLDEINRVNKNSERSTQILGSLDGAEPSSQGESITLTGKNLNAYLDSLDAFLAEVALSAKKNDQEALALAGAVGTTDKERLQNAVLAFTKKQGQALLHTEDAGKGGEEVSLTISGNSLTLTQKASDFGLAGSNLLTAKDAGTALDAVKKALELASSRRSGFGAEQNRLEHTLDSLAKMEENLAASLSKITDADMAKEMIAYTKEKILAQTSAFLMIHENKRPNEVLALLGLL